jgi:hypothetical protein
MLDGLSCAGPLPLGSIVISRATYVQYGCGLCAPPGWRNFDSSPTLRLQRLPLVGATLKSSAVIFPANAEFGDVIKGLPVRAGECQGVYCSHVLEHLALNDLRTALRETYRILSGGGIFRLVLPDLEREARAYLDDESSTAAINFMRATLLGKEDRGRSIKAFLREWLGNSHHLWMWDFKSLRTELQEAGFREVRRAELGDSVDPKFGEVEDAGRWISCLGVECRR